VVAQTAGVFQYFYFTQDQADQVSEVACSQYLVSDAAPSIDMRWDDPTLSKPYAMLSDFRSKISAFINARHILVGPESLDLQCKGSFRLGSGDSIPASSVVCTSDQCKGKNLGGFVPCSGEIQMDFRKAYARPEIAKSVFQLTALAKDGSGHDKTEQLSFWLDTSKLKYERYGLGENVTNEKFTNIIYPTGKQTEFLELAYPGDMDTNIVNSAAMFRIISGQKILEVKKFDDIHTIVKQVFLGKFSNMLVVWARSVDDGSENITNTCIVSKFENQQFKLVESGIIEDCNSKSFGSGETNSFWYSSSDEDNEQRKIWYFDGKMISNFTIQSDEFTDDSSCDIHKVLAVSNRLYIECGSFLYSRGQNEKALSIVANDSVFKTIWDKFQPRTADSNVMNSIAISDTEIPTRNHFGEDRICGNRYVRTTVAGKEYFWPLEVVLMHSGEWPVDCSSIEIMDSKTLIMPGRNGSLLTVKNEDWIKFDSSQYPFEDHSSIKELKFFQDRPVVIHFGGQIMEFRDFSWVRMDLVFPPEIDLSRYYQLDIYASRYFGVKQDGDMWVTEDRLNWRKVTSNKNISDTEFPFYVQMASDGSVFWLDWKTKIFNSDRHGIHREEFPALEMSQQSGVECMGDVWFVTRGKVVDGKSLEITRYSSKKETFERFSIPGNAYDLISRISCIDEDRVMFMGGGKEGMNLNVLFSTVDHSVKTIDAHVKNILDDFHWSAVNRVFVKDNMLFDVDFNMVNSSIIKGISETGTTFVASDPWGALWLYNFSEIAHVDLSRGAGN
ncbi:MAG: hypothetical protein H7249_01525, partial [Chitinophagaceae bacterium]|nr:hypothetical protein [Oligoflexus sp.]